MLELVGMRLMEKYSFETNERINGDIILLHTHVYI